MSKKKILIVLGIIVALLAIKSLLGGTPSDNTTLVDRTYKPITSESNQFKYLAFQLFTDEQCQG